MRVLCDAIHADLQESLALLLEDRFGWELYYPAGMEWYNEGIWSFERDRLKDAVAKQFLQHWLGDEGVPGPGTEAGPFIKRADSTHPGRVLKRVTMEQARELQPDVVISTLMANDAGLHRFAREVGARFGVHSGNQGQACAYTLADFAMLSTTTPEVKPWMPHVYYHQEFSRELFYPDGGQGAARSQQVMTRVQCAAQSEGYELFKELSRTSMGTFRHYGHCGPADDLFGGDAHTTNLVAEQMHTARIAWHWKRWSDGYGHVIHNWAAIGRPMFVTADYYRGKLAEPLFVEGVTSFNIENKGSTELRKLVNALIKDDGLYQQMCVAAAARFDEVVSFDAEAEAIRAMFSQVL